MPDVRLPNGKIVRNVPEGTTKKELARKLRAKGHITDEEFAEMVPRAALDESLSAGERFLIGTGRGMVDAAEGMEQLGRRGAELVGFDAGADEFTEEAQRERDLYERGELGFAGGAGRIAGEAAAFAVPGAGALRSGQAAAKAVPALARLGGALTGSRLGRAGLTAAAGAAGGGSTFVEPGQSRAQNAAVGGVGGLILSPAVLGLSKKLQRGFRRLGQKATRAKRKKQAMESLRDIVPEDQLQQITDDIADGFTPEQAIAKAEIERIGATPTTGRISGNVGDLSFEVRQSRIDPELAGKATAELQELQQQNKRQILASAQELAADFGSEEDLVPDRVGRGLQETLIEAKDRVRQRVVKPAFREPLERLAEFGDSVQVTPNNLARVIDEQVDNLTLPEMQPLLSALRRAKLLQGDKVASVVQKGKKGVQFLDSKGNVLFDTSTPDTESLRRLTAGRAEALHKALSRAQVSRDAKMVKKNLLDALEADVTDTFGEDLFKAARATSKREFFDKFVNPSRVNAFINGEIPPEKLAQQIQNSFNLDETKAFFRTIDEFAPERAQHLRGAIMKDVVRKVHGATTDAEGLPEITGATFLKNMEKLGDERLDTIFGEGTAKSMKQFARAVQRLASVDRRAAGPNTANDLINALQGSGFAVQSKSPILGSLIISGSRILGNVAKENQVAQRARRALNPVILANEQVLRDINRQAISLAGATASGSQAAQGAQAGRERLEELYGIQQR